MSQEKPVALITGATRGIGRAIALAFANEGYDIAFCYYSNVSLAESLSKELQAFGANVVGQQCDIGIETEVDKLFSAIEESFNRLDVLVNNAGLTRDGLLATMPINDITTVLQTNVLGTLLCSRKALALMLPARQGSIINISSISATQPNRGQCNYAASKGAVESLTRALAVEVAGKGIRVNAVAPGVIKTDMADAIIEQYEHTIKKRLLAKSLGTADDIARAALFLANPDNHYITGEILPVNGGMTLT